MRNTNGPLVNVRHFFFGGILQMKIPIAANDNVKGGTVLLRFPDLKAVNGITFSRSHLARLEEAGVFPKRVRTGAQHDRVA
jgi:predicted DNA-binding transcriptional regulator AlpA